MQALQVWMNGELVGRWVVDRQSHTFSYEQSWLRSEKRRSLSLSLPISSSMEIKGDAVKHYFDNLLPDNDKIRQRLGRRYQTRPETFELLQAMGRDCVGAVQLLPDGVSPDGWDQVHGEALSEEQMGQILQAVPSDHVALPDEDLFRISIAGAQEKTAFSLLDGVWCRPTGSTPTTHIFKLALGLIGGSARVDASDSVQNEWLCMQIVAALGLPVANSAIASFAGQNVLVVERFDRAWMDGGKWIARLPQEDFCQALAIAPDHKYEKDGGPGMRDCLQLLQGSADKNDRSFFLLTQLAFCLLAATDGHAKNYSIFLERGDTYRMTPLYDILSVRPYIGKAAHQFSWHKAGLAMAMRSKNPHYAFKEIHTRHWYALAMKNGGPAVWQLMLGLVQNVEQALATVESQLPTNFPEHTWVSISAGMRAEAGRFLSEVADEL